MRLEEIVPPVDLCKLIPAGHFEDCAFCWHYTDIVGFICRTSGCEDVQCKQWQIVNNHRRKIEIRRKHGEEIYPAPTLQEILAEMGWSRVTHKRNVFLCETRKTQGGFAGGYNAAEVALQIWFNKKGVKF